MISWNQTCDNAFWLAEWALWLLPKTLSHGVPMIVLAIASQPKTWGPMARRFWSGFCWQVGVAMFGADDVT